MNADNNTCDDDRWAQWAECGRSPVEVENAARELARLRNTHLNGQLTECTCQECTAEQMTYHPLKRVKIDKRDGYWALSGDVVTGTGVAGLFWERANSFDHAVSLADMWRDNLARRSA